MALGSTQPPTEMNTRNLSWGGKGGRCVGLTTLPPSYADCLKNLGSSSSWIPKGLSRPVMGLLYLLSIYLYTYIPTYLPIYLSMYTYIFLSVYLYSSLSIIYLSIFICIYSCLRS
jgi:hypothetical protein